MPTGLLKSMLFMGVPMEGQEGVPEPEPAIEVTSWVIMSNLRTLLVEEASGVYINRSLAENVKKPMDLNLATEKLPS